MTVAFRDQAIDTASEPPPSAAVDVAVFDGLVASLGDADPGLRHELLEVYLLQSGPQITDLVAAAGRADQLTVGRLAHLMRSSSALLGALGLAGLLGLAEEAARSGLVDDLGPVARRIQLEYGRVAADMAELLSGHAGG